MNFGLRDAILAFCGLIFFVTPSISAESPFYQGKPNFHQPPPAAPLISKGGSSRHPAKHIPGNPTVKRTCRGGGGRGSPPGEAKRRLTWPLHRPYNTT
jgi:hypothetical protein